MRVLVCGDRNWNKPTIIMREMQKFSSDDVCINGCARGADSFARFFAHLAEMKVEDYPARWDKHGKAAGPIRNQQMLDEGKPDLVLAFHNDIENSKGTKDMVLRARKAGIEVRIFKE